MSPASIIIMLIVIPICFVIILYTVCYLVYRKKQNKATIKVYHDLMHYHIPKNNDIVELKNNPAIQFVSTCKVCGKKICLERKHAKKWVLQEDVEDLL